MWFATHCRAKVLSWFLVETDSGDALWRPVLLKGIVVAVLSSLRPSVFRGKPRLLSGSGDGGALASLTSWASPWMPRWPEGPVEGFGGWCRQAAGHPRLRWTDRRDFGFGELRVKTLHRHRSMSAMVAPSVVAPSLVALLWSPSPPASVSGLLVRSALCFFCHRLGGARLWGRCGCRSGGSGCLPPPCCVEVLEGRFIKTSSICNLGHFQ